MSLIELVVTMAVVLVVTGAALSLALSSRSLYEMDEARTELQQSLRVSLDLLGTDIRQAGERLPDDFPAVIIANGGPGVPDQVALRRNLLDVVLPVCKDVDDADNEIYVANVGVFGCNPFDDDDADGWPDNLGTWRTYRLQNGGAVPAYIYDPVLGRGEFFTYELEDSTELYLRRDPVGPLQFSYDMDNQCRVYILEERRYELAGGLLQIVINGAAITPLHVVQGMQDFQALAHFQDGTQQESLGAADVWSDLRSIEVTLDGQADNRGELIDRSLSAEYFPRNVLSR